MNDNDKIDLYDYLDRFFKALKRKWFLCLVVVVAFMTAFCVKSSINYVPSYTSSMVVIVSQKDQNILVSSDATQNTNAAFQKALLSSSMEKIIASDLKMDHVPATISVSLVQDTNFLRVSASSSDPEDAFRVVSSIASNYGQLTKQMNDATMIIIEEAAIPGYPDNIPRYGQIALKGAEIGAGVSLLYLLVYSFTRNTILKEKHIKEKLHLKSCGSIPSLSKKKRSYSIRDQILITNNHIPSGFKDAFRSLVLSIERHPDQKIIMMTSTLPNEGKSTITSNTALMLAQDGKRVLLIDLDLRNPSLQYIFNVENTKEQISTYLNGKCNLEDIITPSEQDKNLDLILGFLSRDNSLEILSRDITEKLLERLKRKYDYIILDVPPLLMMQDAVQCARYSDGIYVVIKQDFAKTYEIVEAIDELLEVNHNIRGCVLNNVDKSLFDEDSRGYGYGYHYGK